MDLRQLPALNAIRAFEAAARHENFSRAADELYVTHGAVSHQVRALEEELGVQLFTRNGKRLCLTDAGMRYAQQIRTALMVIADATREVRSSDRDRRLVVSMLSSFAARFITPRIGSFIERHPEIDVELQSTNSLTDFARDDVDLAIRFGSGTYPGLHVEPLFEEVFFPACAPTLNGGKLPQTPADLVHYNLLRSDDELWRPWFDAAGLDTLTEPKRGCCTRIRRTCCWPRSTARASRWYAARSRYTTCSTGASCACSTSMGRARGTIFSCARRRF